MSEHLGTEEVRPEYELLLLCARLHLDPPRCERLRTLVRQDLDWDLLLQTALDHALMPLVYHHLRETCPEVALSPALGDWRSQFSQKVAWNLFVTGELGRILSLLEAHGICAIPFRGPTLAAWVYGDLALRQFKDLDLLVHQGDVPRAKELLRFLNYDPVFSLSGSGETAFLTFRKAYVDRKSVV